MALEAFKKAPLKTVGEYDIVDKIAEGGMGTVYRGKHQQTGQIVAIKVVPAHMTSNQVLLKRFENEFKAASKLDHPNIVRALDYGTVSGQPYLVMEFVDGESLGQTLERVGKMDEYEAVKVIAEACDGLEEAHRQGMIHRDIKPDNIMVTKDGRVKIADMGLVKDIGDELNLTRTGRGLGTPHFMAPEQFRNAKNADVRCDLYSMGATLYMMLTGELPFKSCGPLDAWMKKTKNDIPPPRKLNPKISERVDTAIQRAMHPEPAKRPQSCREFVADIQGPPPEPSTELWYMVYRDRDGEKHTVKGTAATIRKQYREGNLGDARHILLSRTKKEQDFHSIATCPEFGDLFGAVAATDTPPDQGAAAEGDLGHTSMPLVDASEPTPSSAGIGEQSSTVEILKMLIYACVAMAVGMLAFIYFGRR